MTDDWKAGDYALCINSSWKPSVKNSPTPKVGSIYTVYEVDVDPIGDVGFWLVGFPNDDYEDGFRCEYFIKVTPDEDMEVEREVVLEFS